MVAFHEALVVSCCKDATLMLWSTQINLTIKSEDWTPVVLENRKRFLELVRIIEGIKTKILCFFQSETIKKLRKETKELQNEKEYAAQQLETKYLADLQRRMAMSDNELRHQENLIQRVLNDKEKAKTEFERKWADLTEKFQADKRRIGR